MIIAHSSRKTEWVSFWKYTQMALELLKLYISKMVKAVPGYVLMCLWSKFQKEVSQIANDKLSITTV